MEPTSATQMWEVDRQTHTENHNSPEQKRMSRNLCESQHWGRKTQTVIELLEAQCGSVWDLRTPAGSRLNGDLTPFWILSSGALPGSQSKDWRKKKITSGFQQQEEESSQLEICSKHSMLFKIVALKNIIFLEANLLWFYQSPNQSRGRKVIQTQPLPAILSIQGGGYWSACEGHSSGHKFTKRLRPNCGSPCLSNTLLSCD